jgi:flagellar basal-body rod protein FlgG
VIRGIYISASGMLAESARQDVIANNLANADTVGFKRAETAAIPFVDFLLRSVGMPGAPLVGPLQMGAQVDRTDTILRQGSLQTTGNTLDMALVGDGYFAVETPEGRRYSRDGSFRMRADGTLITKEGWEVAGVGGPIVLGQGPVKVREDGLVFQDGAQIGQLELVALDPDTVDPQGESLFLGDPAGAATARVQQGHLESSNVQVVEEMVELIRVMRSFESNQRAHKAQDETLGDAVNRVGRSG